MSAMPRQVGKVAAPTECKAGGGVPMELPREPVREVEWEGEGVTMTWMRLVGGSDDGGDVLRIIVDGEAGQGPKRQRRRVSMDVSAAKLVEGLIGLNLIRVGDLKGIAR